MLVNYSLIFISLVLFAGVAVDVGMLERGYLRLQSGAQAAALAGAVALQRGGTPATVTAAAQVVAAANGYTNGANGVTVTLENPPSSGSYAGNALALRAIITRTMPGTFLAFAGLGNVNMKAQALQVTASSVNLASIANINAIYTDGTTISGGGLDTSGYSYSANALGQVRAANNLGALIFWRGNIFTLGQPNVANGVSNKTITLSGTYSQMLILATTVYGPMTSQSFVVTYADGSTATSIFNMSDWCNNSAYAGETLVTQAAYRDAQPGGQSTPTQQAGNINIYGYTINLNSTKALSSLQLPAVRNVVLLGLDLKP